MKSTWLPTHPMVVLLLPLVLCILVWHYSPFANHDTPESLPPADSCYTYLAVVRDYPSPRKRTERLLVQPLCRLDSPSVAVPKRLYLYLQTDTTEAARPMPQLLDTIVFRAPLRPGGLLGTFDYGQYLRQQGIEATAYVPTRRWQLLQPAHSRWYHPRYWQHSLVKRYRDVGISEPEAGTLAALTLGYREDLDPALKRSFRVAGASHVLAVSGLHTAVIAGALLFLLTLGGRFRPLYHQSGRRRLIALLSVTIMWAYALLTGMTPSVVRSVLLFTLMMGGMAFYRQVTPINSLAAAAFLILCFRPTDLFSVSFQLSFAAVLALLLVLPEHTLLPWHKWSFPGVKALRWVEGLIEVSLAAQLGTLPLTLYYFGQTSNYFLLTNLIAIPLVTLMAYSALLFFTLGWIPYLTAPLAWVCERLTWLLNHATLAIESLPHATSYVRISASMTCLLYVALACGTLCLKRQRLIWLLPTAASLALFCWLYTIV